MSKFTWGWIDKDGVRCKECGNTNANPDTIIGIWGKLGLTYHETYLKECTPETGKVNNWTIRPLATLLDINRERTYRYARNKKLVINEIVPAPEPDQKKRILQKWKCKCGHTFYSPLLKMPNPIKRVWGMLSGSADCQNCHSKTAYKNGIIRKDARNGS